MDVLTIAFGLGSVMASCLGLPWLGCGLAVSALLSWRDYREWPAVDAIEAELAAMDEEYRHAA